MPLTRFFPCLQLRLNDDVCKLDYSNNSLCDCFPNVWQYERTLEELNIASAKVNCLPPQLFYCQGLKVLLASNNNIKNIPEAIGALRMLQNLNMNRNFISNVPDNIKCCKNLTHLDLSSNNLQKIPDAITCLISLQEILLNETCLEFLPANFGRLVNLRIIELRSNNLVSLPKSMHRLRNLIRLDIGCNDFTVLPEVIGELRQLRELWFDSNQIQHFPFFLGKLQYLIHCEANDNCFQNMPHELSGCRNLELLSVSTNSLKQLFCGVGMLKSLVTFKCENNGLAELPGSISMLENLVELDVRRNILECLPKSIGLLRNLQYFFADENNLRDIPDEICSCSALRILSISRNKITELPSNLGHLHQLKVLNIVENNIGSLPVTVLSLNNLKSLWISCNQSKPLITLQYTDISKKSELTCFMLPQVTSEYQSVLETHSNKQELFKEKRRIFFAEQATVFSSGRKPLISFSAPSANVSSCLADNGRHSELLLSPPKDLLVRSPTPYSKELRSLSQFVQENQHIIGTPSSKHNGTKSVNYNTQNLNDTKHESTLMNKSELYQKRSNCSQHNITNSTKENNLQFTSEILQNVNDYQMKVRKICNTNIMGEQMSVIPFHCSRKKTECHEERHEEIANDDFAKNIEHSKCNILSAEIHCLHPNIKKNSRNKWLFGVHKNPRVIQVQVIWEKGCDITVNFMPKREGIYVISTVPESSASKALLPFDKLLEVDGTDFTCISLDEARQVLDKPRPIINIMLSR